jgi:aspartate racemase
LVAAGIDGLVLCANTLHFAVPQINEKFNVPIIHIARVTAIAIREKKLKTVGLLGTRQTMEQHFYTDILDAEGIKTLVPEIEEREYIDWVIFNELAKEQFHEHTRQRFLQIINSLKMRGAEGIILGCTEIPLLIHSDQTVLPLFNTLEIHARAAVVFAIE